MKLFLIKNFRTFLNIFFFNLILVIISIFSITKTYAATPFMYFSPNSGGLGDIIYVTGSSFPINDKIAFSAFGTHLNDDNLCTSNSKGDLINCSFKIPADIPSSVFNGSSSILETIYAVDTLNNLKILGSAELTVTNTTVPPGITIPNPFGKAGYTDIINNITKNITNIVLSVIVVILMSMILYGGYLLMFGGANEENTKKAQKVITSAIIGVLIFASIMFIIKFVENILGVSLNFNFLF